ncbi:hypothetical protein [Arthrobacter sp. H5]|uniref:hypothetical protein n=1 Tax=Arthrobacter sp. H5 TaxID=1267973 RepID=UPI001C1E802E|nr:hypothetical protein [Arthrobacter sp. H5]
MSIGALLIYGFLRLTAFPSSKDFDGRRAARSHGFWTAVIALFASSTASNSKYSELGPVWNSDQFSHLESQGVLSDLLPLIVPVASLGGIYILAQFTWPRPTSAVRVADISARRIRDFLPRHLTMLTLFIALVAAALLVAAAFLPAVSGTTAAQQGITMPSRVSGAYFGSLMGASFISLLTFAAAAVAVIVRRRRIPTLTVEDDALVRRISINRLLRTVILALAGVINATVAYGANGTPTDRLHTIDTPSWWGFVSNPSGIFSVVIAITVLAWAPPKLADDPAEPLSAPLASSGSYARALEISSAGRRLGSVLLVLPGIPIVLTIWNPWTGALPLGLITVGFTVFLVVQLVVEYLLRQNHSTGPSGAVPIQGLVPMWLRLALAFALTAVLTAVLVLNIQSPRVVPELLSSLGAVMLLAGLAAAGIWRALTRPRLSGVDGVQDLLLRAVTLHRVFRGCTSGLLMLLAYLLTSQEILWSAAVGEYRASSEGLHPALIAAQAAVIAAAAIIVLLPGPTRPPAHAPAPAGESLYP